MAIICEEEEGIKMKRARTEYDDRLNNLSESLQLHILSFLDTKHAVQTLLLSRPWLSLWTWMPVLHLNSSDFRYVHRFDKFVNKVLRLRDPSAKLNRLTYNRYRQTCNPKMLKKVVGYAISHGVNQLEVSIYQISKKGCWPVDCLDASSDSLTSLKLCFRCLVSCPFLGLGILFKNLTVLYLGRANITTVEPFSGFPMLEKFTLYMCSLRPNLHVHAPKLSDLTIWYGCFNRFELTTPNLRYFECRGSVFPVFRAPGLPVLNTAVINFRANSCSFLDHRHGMTFDDLMSLFWELQNAKSLTLYSAIIDTLSLFPEKLFNLYSPFCSLKCLNIDYGCDGSFRSPVCETRPRMPSSFEIPSDVKAYLLHKSPDAKITIIYPKKCFCLESCKNAPYLVLMPNTP